MSSKPSAEREAEIRASIERGDAWDRVVSELLALLDSERSASASLREERDEARGLLRGARNVAAAMRTNEADAAEHATAATLALVAEKARADAAERALAELRAAHVGLREAARLAYALMGWDGGQARERLEAALSASPSTLAGQARAAVLREAAASVRSYERENGWETGAPDRLDALAAESERGT